MIKISIIIITWSRIASLKETLNNLLRDPYENKEVIVADNNSTDDTKDVLRMEYPSVIYHFNEQNLGVPGGRNSGIRLAKGDILFFIDNDAELMENGLAKIAQYFENDPQLGILAPQINNYYTKELDLSSWVYSIHKLNNKDNSFDTFAFVGAGFAVRREVFEQCGLFWDELFFMHEESDFAYRVIEQNFTIRYQPQIKVYHKVDSKQRYGISSRFYHYGTRNRLWINLRYYPLGRAVWENSVFLFFQFIAALRTRNLKNFFRGVFESIENIRIPFKYRHKLDKDTLRRIKKLRYIKKDSFLRRAGRVLGWGKSDAQI